LHKMWAIDADGVAWSVSVSVRFSVCLFVC